jgi:hypothetical protein
MECGYLKMRRQRNKTLVAYMVKLGKTTQTSPDHNFKLGARI